MCNTSRMPRITRKRRSTQKQKGKTVPTIRKRFDAFHAFLRTSRSEAEVKRKFKELFGKGKLTKDQIANLLKMPAQKGGMAPLDYAMGSPDAKLSALPYVQSGFGFANMDSVAAGSPKEYLGSTPQMGGRRTRQKRQRGGGVADFAASIHAQPFLSSAPLSALQAGARLATGQIGLPSSHPEINPLNITPPTFIQGAKLVQ
jgi:hypothetical protein